MQNLKFQQGNISLVVFGVILFIVISGGVGYYFISKSKEKSVGQNPKEVQSVQQKEKLQKKEIEIIDETVGWETYTNNDFEYTVKYPDNWKYIIARENPTACLVNIAAG